MYRLGVALALAATLVLAGCGRDRPAAPATAPPTRTVPPSTLGSGTTLVSSLPRLVRGVRFGANPEPDRGLYVVLIDPGFSRLTARQILDRLLGS
jgi:hypothetical protein